jgi:hypothetical protein
LRRRCWSYRCLRRFCSRWILWRAGWWFSWSLCRIWSWCSSNWWSTLAKSRCFLCRWWFSTAWCYSWTKISRLYFF